MRECCKIAIKWKWFCFGVNLAKCDWMHVYRTYREFGVMKALEFKFFHPFLSSQPFYIMFYRHSYGGILIKYTLEKVSIQIHTFDSKADYTLYTDELFHGKTLPRRLALAGTYCPDLPICWISSWDISAVSVYNVNHCSNSKQLINDHAMKLTNQMLSSAGICRSTVLLSCLLFAVKIGMHAAFIYH